MRRMRMAVTTGREDERRSAGWDIRSGPRNYATLIGTQVASSALGLTAAWLTTRMLGVAGYGGIAAILAAAQFVVQLTLSWTSVSVIRYGCEEFVETGRIAATFWTRLLLLSANLLVVLASSPWWLPPLARWLHLPYVTYPWILIYLTISALSIHVQYALQAAKLPRFQGSLIVVEKALLLLGLGALWVCHHDSLISVGGAYILAPIVPASIGAWRLRAMLFPGARIDRTMMGRVLRFSFPLIPFTIVGFLSTNYLDAFFITRYLSAKDLGIYSLAYQLAGTLMQVPQALGSLLLPFFISMEAEGAEDRIAHFFGKVLPALSLAWSLGCSLAIAAICALLPAVFDPQFLGASTLLWPLAAAGAVAGPVLMGYAPLSNAKSMTSISASMAVVSGGTNIALNFLLVPHHGLLGVAWATAAAYGAGAVYAAWSVHRSVPASRSWALFSTLPAAAAAAWASIDGSSRGPGPAVAALACGSLLGLVYRASLLDVIRTLASSFGIPSLRPSRDRRLKAEWCGPAITNGPSIELDIN